ncbi:3-deoxy-D-manno-octulosonic acid transferase [Ancylobacter dichloromethanicus]|uniref:3-deoxy-D-manno-octulosonic acid transferase n=1 Tax=Ancylobacter dichloromethanicus TaxID=518825 RepID=A0A9W6MYS0_9HYPH|nr:3-deoxy-D-manno-octulosonic acid transferase [Ancylobacter dichloromethanicus]MBS7552602.1 3-deoxy-D-manno-octulosonic acid transferase [Ancylobacter dichloromethanicus]GLK71964.1 3-deoxy-D-manno-octulosonic acid transferase [Ancylobacter dichloromethanicus]
MARARSPFLVRLYRAATWLAPPLVRLLLARRLKRGKEDGTRLGERYGRASAPRPRGALVWVHGASVGEMIAVLPLIERLRGRGFRVLFTSGTLTSAQLAQSRLPPDVPHQFVPLDSPLFVRRFLRHWRPDLVLLVESELWPNLIIEVNARGTPLVMVNARMSPASFANWRRVQGSVSALLSRVDLCLAQGPEDGERLIQLGAPRVTVTGNLKFDAPPPPVDIAAFDALRTATAGRVVFIAASTHPGEEEIVIEAHQRLAKELPNLLTIIAPRHPERGVAVVELATAAGCPAVLRSDGYRPDKGTAIYVADTIGELGLFYRLGPVALLGGSLVRKGGQNPIEPIKLDTAILHGPNVTNFNALYARLDEAGGAAPVTDARSLAAAAYMLLADGASRGRMIAAGQATVENFGGALERTLAAIDPYLVQIRLERR